MCIVSLYSLECVTCEFHSGCTLPIRCVCCVDTEYSNNTRDGEEGARSPPVTTPTQPASESEAHAPPAANLSLTTALLVQCPAQDES